MATSRINSDNWHRTKNRLDSNAQIADSGSLISSPLYISPLHLHIKRQLFPRLFNNHGDSSRVFFATCPDTLPPRTTRWRCKETKREEGQGGGGSISISTGSQQ